MRDTVAVTAPIRSEAIVVDGAGTEPTATASPDTDCTSPDTAAVIAARVTVAVGPEDCVRGAGAITVAGSPSLIDALVSAVCAGSRTLDMDVSAGTTCSLAALAARLDDAAEGAGVGVTLRPDVASGCWVAASRSSVALRGRRRVSW